MAREEFLDNLRNAAYDLDLRRKHDPERRRWAKRRPSRWLIPRTVAAFDAMDFPELSEAERQEMTAEIGQFLKITESGPSAASAVAVAKRLRAREGLVHLKRIVALTGKAVLAEWMDALSQFMHQAETWALARDWGVKRDTIAKEEEILGSYDAPRLLIHTLDNKRFFLEPTGRNIVAATGRVDLTIIPSEDSVGIFRNGKGWFVMPLGLTERNRPWTRAVFYSTLDRLAETT
jgi:hypothetical protein